MKSRPHARPWVSLGSELSRTMISPAKPFRLLLVTLVVAWAHVWCCCESAVGDDSAPQSVEARQSSPADAHGCCDKTENEPASTPRRSPHQSDCDCSLTTLVKHEVTPFAPGLASSIELQTHIHLMMAAAPWPTPRLVPQEWLAARPPGILQDGCRGGRSLLSLHCLLTT